MYIPVRTIRFFISTIVALGPNQAPAVTGITKGFDITPLMGDKNNHNWESQDVQIPIIILIVSIIVSIIGSIIA